MPVYNDTPLATNPINQTQAPIRTNFQTLLQTININHVDPSDPNDFGKHKWVTFPQQVQATAQAANTYPDLGIYNAPYGLTTINELWVRNSGFNPTDIPFTAVSYTGVGWTTMPSGIVFKWGQTGAIPAAGTLNFTIPNGTSTTGPSIPAGQILHCQLTPVSGAGNFVSVVFVGTTGTANEIVVGSSTGAVLGAAYFVIGFVNSF